MPRAPRPKKPKVIKPSLEEETTTAVTVVDNQGPVLTCPPNIVVNAAAGQSASDVTFNVTASDV